MRWLWIYPSLRRDMKKYLIFHYFLHLSTDLVNNRMSVAVWTIIADLWSFSSSLTASASLQHCKILLGWKYRSFNKAIHLLRFQHHCEEFKILVKMIADHRCLAHYFKTASQQLLCCIPLPQWPTPSFLVPSNFWTPHQRVDDPAANELSISLSGLSSSIIWWNPIQSMWYWADANWT